MTKFPVFWDKIKTKTYIKKMRHAFLDMNVCYMYLNFRCWGFDIKWGVLAQKIKVKKSVFNSHFSEFTNVILLLIINT